MECRQTLRGDLDRELDRRYSLAGGPHLPPAAPKWAPPPVEVRSGGRGPGCGGTRGRRRAGRALVRTDGGAAPGHKVLLKGPASGSGVTGTPGQSSARRFLLRPQWPWWSRVTFEILCLAEPWGPMAPRLPVRTVAGPWSPACYSGLCRGRRGEDSWLPFPAPARGSRAAVTGPVLAAVLHSRRTTVSPGSLPTRPIFQSFPKNVFFMFTVSEVG